MFYSLGSKPAPIDVQLQHLQNASPIMGLGSDGNINVVENKNGTMYTKRFSEINNGKGCGAAISYPEGARRPNQIIMTPKSVEKFYGDGVAIKMPRYGESGLVKVICQGGNSVVGYMNEAGDVVSLEGYDEKLLSKHGKESETAIKRMSKKFAKYLEKHPPKIR